MVAERKPRLGRPPASSSADTRDRILVVARSAFAELGYGVTTNRYVATKAGITTGALYHYFDSKLEMYRAVYDHVQDVVTGRISAAIAQQHTFIGQLEALLETSHQLNGEDPTLAQFVGSARIDIARHDELRQQLGPLFPGQGRQFIPNMVRLGLATGEIPRGQQAAISAFLRAMLVGLVDAVSEDLAEHRRAIDATLDLMRGRLLTSR